MPLKCIYPLLGPRYYDFMGFDRGFLSFLALFLFAFFLILTPQLIRSMERMKDTALFQKIEGQQRPAPPPPLLEFVHFLLSSSSRVCVRACTHCIRAPRLHLALGTREPESFSLARRWAYTYQSGRGTDGRHSSGPQMSSSSSSVSCLKAQCGHMSLSYRISDADEMTSALIRTLFALFPLFRVSSTLISIHWTLVFVTILIFCLP